MTTLTDAEILNMFNSLTNELDIVVDDAIILMATYLGFDVLDLTKKLAMLAAIALNKPKPSPADVKSMMVQMLTILAMRGNVKELSPKNTDKKYTQKLQTFVTAYKRVGIAPASIGAAFPAVMMAVMNTISKSKPNAIRDPVETNKPEGGYPIAVDLPVICRFSSFPALIPKANLTNKEKKLWEQWMVWAAQFDKIVNTKKDAAGQRTEADKIAYISYADTARTQNKMSDIDRRKVLTKFGLIFTGNADDDE